MSKRYELRLDDVELEQVDNNNTKLHLQYELRDSYGCTQRETTLEDITLLLNSLHTQMEHYRTQAYELNERRIDLESHLAKRRECDSLENELFYTICDKMDNQVKNDIIPLLQTLMVCFNCIYESNSGQYENNLIMLKYHVKGFKEVCKE